MQDKTWAMSDNKKGIFTGLVKMPLMQIIETYRVTVQQVCALAALTVRKHRLEGKNPIGAADLEWTFARNYEGTEQLPYRKYLEYTFNFYDNRYKLVCHGTLFCTRIVT